NVSRRLPGCPPNLAILDERHSVEMQRRFQQNRVKMNSGLVRPSERNVGTERDVSRSPRLLVENSRSDDVSAGIDADSEFGDRSTGARAARVERLEQPTGCLACGIDNPTLAQAQVERSSQESIARKRPVNDDCPLALGLDRSDVRLAGRQITECA